MKNNYLPVLQREHMFGPLINWHEEYSELKNVVKEKDQRIKELEEIVKQFQVCIKTADLENVSNQDMSKCLQLLTRYNEKYNL